MALARILVLLLLFGVAAAASFPAQALAYQPIRSLRSSAFLDGYLLVIYQTHENEVEDGMLVCYGEKETLKWEAKEGAAGFSCLFLDSKNRVLISSFDGRVYHAESLRNGVLRLKPFKDFSGMEELVPMFEFAVEDDQWFISGRRQLLLYSEGKLAPMILAGWDELWKQEKIEHPEFHWDFSSELPTFGPFVFEGQFGCSTRSQIYIVEDDKNLTVALDFSRQLQEETGVGFQRIPYAGCISTGNALCIPLFARVADMALYAVAGLAESGENLHILDAYKVHQALPFITATDYADTLNEDSIVISQLGPNIESREFAVYLFQRSHGFVDGPKSVSLELESDLVTAEQRRIFEFGDFSIKYTD